MKVKLSMLIAILLLATTTLFAQEFSAANRS